LEVLSWTISWTISWPVILHRQGAGGSGPGGGDLLAGGLLLHRFCDIVSMSGDNITELLISATFRLPPLAAREVEISRI